MSLESLSASMLPAVENEMKQMAQRADSPHTKELYRMIAYHLGWQNENSSAKPQGKRIRPLLVLLTASAAGEKWRYALPAAASVELLHNFTLIHDDIQDNSPLRRGRPTVWKKWGVPQAINTGDTMFTLAHWAMLRLGRTTSPKIAHQAAGLLHQSCLLLTQGQHMDISFETRNEVSLEEYWSMINGKTAALLAACTELGALIAQADKQTRTAYREFGRNLGLAFQVQDDLLGIWGDVQLTGKSSVSDLVTGKKTLPVLVGLQQKGPFYKRWKQGSLAMAEALDLADQLESEGAREYTQEMAEKLTGEAVRAFERASPQGEARDALKELTNMLLNRSR